MTLTSTIRRREKRKRAKLRAEERMRAPRGPAFITLDWLVRDHLADFARQLRTARYLHREYK